MRERERERERERIFSSSGYLLHSFANGPVGQVEYANHSGCDSASLELDAWLVYAETCRGSPSGNLPIELKGLDRGETLVGLPQLGQRLGQRWEVVTPRGVVRDEGF